MNNRQERALLLIWVTSLIATAGSLYFSEIRGYIPCDLCWIQRIFMYPILIMTTIAYLQQNAKIAVTTATFSVIGGCISLYHYGLQKLSFLQENAPACSSGSCIGQYINWFGFMTIPFLALTAFIIIALTSFYLIKASKEEQ